MLQHIQHRIHESLTKKRDMGVDLTLWLLNKIKGNLCSAKMNSILQVRLSHSQDSHIMNEE